MRQWTWRVILAAVVLAAGVAAHPAAAGAGPGSPRFVVPDRTAGGGVLPQDLATGDFTRDGRDDVHRVVADFTGDGKPDVFSINPTDRGLYSIYVNRTR